MNKIFLLIIMFMFTVSLISCSAGDGSNNSGDSNDGSVENEGDSIMNEKVYVLITLDDNRTIKLELFPEIAPITVNNFLSLVEAKYYDGVIFHRVIENFMIQTGGYYIEDKTLYQKQPVKQIVGEFSSNGYVNNLKHEPGVISMARTSDPNSATAQFFICSATSEHLDGEYAAFGKTVDQASLDVVMDISKVPTGFLDYSFQNFPIEPITIKSIRRVTNE